MERNEHAIKMPTTGVFDFPSLILGGKGKYVDKTDLLYRLCNDAVIETPGEVCVLEFKYAKSAKAAIRQIRERGYADKWSGGPRP